MLIVERHYLKTYGGGFTENFYGLKRSRVLRTKGGEVPRAQLGAPGHVREAVALGRGDVWRNLAVIVGLPYIKRKLDEGYDIHAAHVGVLGQRGVDTLPATATLRQRIIFYYKWFLRRVYPSVNAAYYFSLLAFNLAYLFDGSKYHNPFLWLIGTRMRRLGEADYRAIDARLNPPSPAPRAGARPGQGGSIFHPRTMGRAVYPRLLSSLKILLPTSIFALKFLEWWYASDFARQLSRKAAEGIELPPPVISGLSSLLNKTSTPKAQSEPQNTPSKDTTKPTTPAEKTDSPRRNPPISSTTYLPILTVTPPSKSTSSLCPICASPIINATAAPSGFVFCYTCIHKWVDGAHERQTAFMEGGGGEEGWGSEEGSREGRWESGRGRCAVSGRRVLGGTSGLRRVVV